MTQLNQLDADMFDDGQRLKQEIDKYIKTFNSSLNKTVGGIQRTLNTLNKKIQEMDTICTIFL